MVQDGVGLLLHDAALCQHMAAQTWYSGADADAFDEIKDIAAHFCIEDGQLRA